MLGDARRLLEAGIRAHGCRDFAPLEREFERMSSEYARSDAPLSGWISYVLYFVDNWLDASNHEWHYHPPVLESDWVPLAQALLLSSDTPQQFSPPTLRGVTLDRF